MSRPDAKARHFGLTPKAYQALQAPADKDAARRVARQRMAERFGAIFQRRHDCIHNCDRPKAAPQSLARSGTVLKVIQDVEFLVHRCDEHINVEFREFLVKIGCNAATIRQAGY